METYSRESIQVGINYYSGDPIVVKLTVTPPDRTTNPGAFVLDPSYKAIPAGYPALASNEYYVTFGSARTVPVTIVAMDGTGASCLRGFTVQAEVVTPAWSNAYVSATQRVFVQNVAPAIDATLENASAWMVSGGVASKYPIRWQIRSDVEADLAAGITVRFEGCENAFTTNVTEATGGSFVPDFGSWIGSQTVTMTIEDKDGGMLAYSYLYEVLPSKFLKTLAHGPGVGMVASALSQRYERARGRGEGHVYAYGATLSMASNFVQTWNCSRASTVNLTGSGYKVGDVDNGWLDNGRDCALTARGDAADTAMQATDTAGFYRYGDDERDSFLYLWIFHPVDESGMPSDIVPGDTATPEILGRSNPVLSAALPSMVGDDGFYPLTTVEAVFSKEWLAADNLGDINQDGVPDMFAMKTWRAGGASLTALATGGETLANDMVNIGELNPDESYLPRTSYGEFTNEVPFTVRLQLRGMGDGLNDAVSQTTDMDVSERVYASPMTNALGEAYWGWSNACSLNELEFCAWRAYAEANGLDWADPLNWTEWSPERPTDPTVSDTDGDGMPDGFEYRYWYLAHVGYFETNADGQKVFRQLEGSRFDPKDPLGFQVVPAWEIAALMDPLTPGEDAATRDSDNDGVSDLAEIQAGQDPFDFHDAIHLPYYEIEDGVLLSVYMGEEASAVIPHTVTSIGEAAFYGCSGLASVTIPDSVTSIGMAAFYGCSGLEDVTIPGSVTNIGSYAFYDCGNLTRIRLPKRLEGHIDESVFDGCPGTLTVTYYESPYTIRFHRNDASDEKVETRDFDYGVETHLPSLAKLGWARRGCDFLGWATSRANADAGKVWKKDWAAVASPVAAGETLDVYAVWALKPGSYAIQFIRNDGAGTWRTVGFNYGEKTRMPSLANGLGWARRGYDFKGWALTTADANAGKVWKEDWAYVATPVKAGEVLTVYAVWALKPGYYQIRFNKNDGGGKWRTLGFACDKSTKLSTIAGLGWERPGYRFRGWASNKANADAGKVWKPDGEWVTNATAEGRTLSIYAIWE